jgi:hypothetical protein
VLDPGAGLGQLVDPVGDVVLGQVREVRAERVRLDEVGARLEVRVVDATHHVGPRDVEDLVAALQPLEVVEGQVGGLEHRAHGPVGDEYALRQRLQQRRPGLRHAARLPAIV